jgi:hypothetical protein
VSAVVFAAVFGSEAALALLFRCISWAEVFQAAVLALEEILSFRTEMVPVTVMGATFTCCFTFIRRHSHPAYSSPIRSAHGSLRSHCLRVVYPVSSLSLAVSAVSCVACRQGQDDVVRHG